MIIDLIKLTPANTIFTTNLNFACNEFLSTVYHGTWYALKGIRVVYE